MEKILIPTDFSTCADKALQYAASIAQRAQAELLVLHASTELMPAKLEGKREMIETYNQPIEQNTNTQLEAVAQQARQLGVANVTTLLYDGDLGASIQNAIEQYGVSLIVMGTEGATGLIKKILGSNTAATMSNVDVPVISIPSGYDGTGIQKILLALKHTEGDLKSLEPVFELGRLFNAPISLAIYSGEGAEAVDYIGDRRTIAFMQNRLQEMYGQQLEAEHLTGSNFEDTLQQYIAANSIDLLVMITHQRSGLIETLFNRSLTRKMAYHSTIPLLSLRNQDAEKNI